MMRLLIVDDQPWVLEGLMQGIDWRAEGFDEVTAVCSAAKAREKFKTAVPDILICDIEMPTESGLELVRWAEGQGFDTCYIFLTSHAEFLYAREALHLGAFDYIVQPAPYQEVLETVRRAVQEVNFKKQKQLAFNVGEQLLEEKIQVASSVQRDLLTGGTGDRLAQTLSSLGMLPPGEKKCFAAAVQILRWHSMTERMEGREIALEMSRIANQVFTQNGCHVAVSLMDESLFAFVLQEEGDVEELRGSLVQFTGQCEAQLRCSLACYLDGPMPFRQMAEGYRRLLEKKKENVSLRSGVFWGKQDGEEEKKHSYYIARIGRWGKLLAEGYGPAMEREAFGCLDELAAGGLLSPGVLRHFYQDFLYMACGNERSRFEELFPGPEEWELYRNGMNSIDDMKALIRHVASRCRMAGEENGADPKTAVFELIRYINDHLDREFRRDELAEHVHLNPDYMARIFKKEIGITIKEYIIKRKMREAQSLLRTTSLPVSFIAAKLGYSNFSYFSQTYRKTMGISPQEERNGDP